LNRPALPVLGASALAVVLASTVALTTTGATAPAGPLVSAQSAVDPVPVELGSEHSDIAQRKDHARASAAAARAAAEQAAAEQAAAAVAAAEQAAADKAAADRTAAAQRASRSARNADPRAIARALLAARGQAGQFSCLDSLWTRESEWRWDADNPSSSAYGIPQALPGSKMASAGTDWRTNPETQIRWGLGYISQSYGTPCAAWRHSQANNWY